MQEHKYVSKTFLRRHARARGYFVATFRKYNTRGNTGVYRKSR